MVKGVSVRPYLAISVTSYTQFMYLMAKNNFSLVFVGKTKNCIVRRTQDQTKAVNSKS